MRRLAFPLGRERDVSLDLAPCEPVVAEGIAQGGARGRYGLALILSLLSLEDKRILPSPIPACLTSHDPPPSGQAKGLMSWRYLPHGSHAAPDSSLLQQHPQEGDAWRNGRPWRARSFIAYRTGYDEVAVGSPGTLITSLRGRVPGVVTPAASAYRLCGSLRALDLVWPQSIPKGRPRPGSPPPPGPGTSIVKDPHAGSPSIRRNESGR